MINKSLAENLRKRQYRIHAVLLLTILTLSIISLSLFVHASIYKKRIANSYYYIYLTPKDQDEIKTTFAPGDSVDVWIENTDNQRHTIITVLEIFDPSNTLISQTKEPIKKIIPGPGRAKIFEWSVPVNVPTGKWKLHIILQDDTGKQYEDTLYFNIQSPTSSQLPQTPVKRASSQQNILFWGLLAAIIAGVAILSLYLLMSSKKKQKPEQYIPPAPIPEWGAEQRPQQGGNTVVMPPSMPSSESTIVAPQAPVTQGSTVVALAKLVTPTGEVIPITSMRQRFGREDFQRFLPAHQANMISRRSKPHFEIYFDPQTRQFYIVDNNSTNGTLLNGENIKGRGPQPLNDGDKINPAGVLELTFKL